MMFNIFRWTFSLQSLINGLCLVEEVFEILRKFADTIEWFCHIMDYFIGMFFFHLVNAFIRDCYIVLNVNRKLVDMGLSIGFFQVLAKGQVIFKILF
jgi:hypothetical protein